MWYVAFTLGLFGGLHCIGMCGALSCGMCTRPNQNRNQAILTALQYQLGRVATYILLGLLFGLFGQVMYVANIQNWTSILLGVMMIVMFLFSIDLERHMAQSNLFGRFYFTVKSRLSLMYKHSQSYPPLLLGMVNGLLPCGMVYLSLAGSMASDSMLSSAIFMAAFGLGTVPLMFLTTIGAQSISMRVRGLYSRVLPIVTLCFGLFLIYRGVMSEMPAELDFWHAIKHPVMCIGGR